MTNLFCKITQNFKRRKNQHYIVSACDHFSLSYKHDNGHIFYKDENNILAISNRSFFWPDTRNKHSHSPMNKIISINIVTNTKICSCFIWDARIS